MNFKNFVWFIKAISSIENNSEANQSTLVFPTHTWIMRRSGTGGFGVADGEFYEPVGAQKPPVPGPSSSMCVYESGDFKKSSAEVFDCQYRTNLIALSICSLGLREATSAFGAHVIFTYRPYFLRSGTKLHCLILKNMNLNKVAILFFLVNIKKLAYQFLLNLVILYS